VDHDRARDRLVAVNLIKPGVGLALPTEASGISANAQSWREVLLHLVPESVFKAMVEGDVLQLVVFSVDLRHRARMIGEKGKPVLHFCEGLAETMFKFTNIIMH